jgi:tellurite resistance protein
MSEPEARKLKEKMDRRLLILYALLVVVIAVSLTYIQYDNHRSEDQRAKFEHAVVENCEIGQKNTEAFNDLLNRLIEAVKQNPNYTDAEKAKAAKFYESGKQTVPECPPVAVEE